MTRTVSETMLALVLLSVLTSTINIQTAEASDTIYIRADGSVDPPTPLISSVDNVTYTFTANINDSIVVERDNIILDGAGYTLQGSGASDSKGIDLSGRSNVTIRDMEIKTFWHGIYLWQSSNISIIGNNITTSSNTGIDLLEFSNYTTISGNSIANNSYGISLWYSPRFNNVTGNTLTNNTVGISLGGSINTVSGNNVTNNGWGVWLGESSTYNGIVQNNISENKYGIWLPYYFARFSLDNTILENNLANNEYGVLLSRTSNCTISGNSIEANKYYGISIEYSSNNTLFGNNITNSHFYGLKLYASSDNFLYHNNFLENGHQVSAINSADFWDHGYPSGGNYWSDYAGTDLHRGVCQNETGMDGIGDIPYSIDENSIDRYPLMKPYRGPHDVGTVITASKTVIGEGYGTVVSINVTIINYGEQSEDINVTVQTNATIPEQTLTLTITDRNSTTVMFAWNTTGLPKGNYTIIANVTPVPDETDLTDNTHVERILITTAGDVTGAAGLPDGKVDTQDIDAICKKFGSKPSSPKWDANCDINNDGVINMRDIGIACNNFMKT